MPLKDAKMIAMPGEGHERVKEIAKRHGLPMYELVLEAVVIYDRLHRDNGNSPPADNDA